MVDLREATISGVHRARAEGKLSFEELAAACLARMQALDKTPPALNAVVVLTLVNSEVKPSIAVPGTSFKFSNTIIGMFAAKFRTVVLGFRSMFILAYALLLFCNGSLEVTIFAACALKRRFV